MIVVKSWTSASSLSPFIFYLPKEDRALERVFRLSRQIGVSDQVNVHQPLIRDEAHLGLPPCSLMWIMRMAPASGIGYLSLNPRQVNRVHSAIRLENFVRLVMLETVKSGGDAHRIPISVTDRSQITNLPTDTQILKGRTTWRNLPSVYLILHDFDYLLSSTLAI